jgi:hypothetical protein
VVVEACRIVIKIYQKEEKEDRRREWWWWASDKRDLLMGFTHTGRG